MAAAAHLRCDQSSTCFKTTHPNSPCLSVSRFFISVLVFLCFLFGSKWYSKKEFTHCKTSNRNRYEEKPKKTANQKNACAMRLSFAMMVHVNGAAVCTESSTSCSSWWWEKLFVYFVCVRWREFRLNVISINFSIFSFQTDVYSSYRFPPTLQSAYNESNNFSTKLYNF